MHFLLGTSLSLVSLLWYVWLHWSVSLFTSACHLPRPSWTSRPAKCPPHLPHPGICLPGGNNPTASGNCSHPGLSPQAASGRPGTRLPSLISVSPAFSPRLIIETTLIHRHGNNEKGYHRSQERSQALRLTPHSVSWHKCILVAG